MVVSWVLNEMKTACLKDKRLNDRLREVLSQLGGHPTASIPAACGGHTERSRNRAGQRRCRHLIS